MARNKKNEEEVGAIDLTPMLDVVFIMLIFFIVTASFIKEPGIEVNRPDALTVEQKANANILVAITADNDIWINKNQVEAGFIETELKVLLSENPTGALVIQADSKANIKTITELTATAREIGIDDVSISANKE